MRASLPMGINSYIIDTVVRFVKRLSRKRNPIHKINIPQAWNSSPNLNVHLHRGSFWLVAPWQKSGHIMTSFPDYAKQSPSPKPGVRELVFFVETVRYRTSAPLIGQCKSRWIYSLLRVTPSLSVIGGSLRFGMPSAPPRAQWISHALI